MSGPSDSPRPPNTQKGGVVVPFAKVRPGGLRHERVAAAVGDLLDQLRAAGLTRAEASAAAAVFHARVVGVHYATPESFAVAGPEAFALLSTALEVEARTVWAASGRTPPFSPSPTTGDEPA